MVLNKDEFLKEYNIDEKFLIDNNIDWNELEKIYNDYSMYRKSYETQANLISNILREHKKVHSVKARVKDENHLIEKIIRKLAHYTIYAVGGFLIMNYAYTTNRKTKEKVFYSTAFGIGYAVTDELHQFFVAGRSASIFDVCIDALGIVTGIGIYVIMRKAIERLKDKAV